MSNNNNSDPHRRDDDDHDEEEQNSPKKPSASSPAGKPQPSSEGTEAKVRSASSSRINTPGAVAVRPGPSMSATSQLDTLLARKLEGGRRPEGTETTSVQDFEQEILAKHRVGESRSGRASRPGAQPVNNSLLTDRDRPMLLTETEDGRISVASQTAAGEEGGVITSLEASIKAKLDQITFAQQRKSGETSASLAKERISGLEEEVDSKLAACDSSFRQPPEDPLKERPLLSSAQSTDMAAYAKGSGQYSKSDYYNGIMSVDKKKDIDPGDMEAGLTDPYGGREPPEGPAHYAIMPQPFDPAYQYVGDDQLDFGMMGGTQSNLAVAMAVDESEEDGQPHQQLNLPSAVQYDPDAKPAESRRRRYRLGIGLLVCGCAMSALGVALGMILSKDNSKPPPSPTPAPTSLRETTGVREAIQAVVGKKRLADPESPYARALDWLLHDDPLMLTLANESLYQRYFATYLYLATSSEMPWTSCGRPAENETHFCTYNQLRYHDQSAKGVYSWVEIPWVRWLSDQPECTWAGVTCDDQGQIRELILAGFNMTGSFPDGIQFFPFLQKMYLVWGSLKGSIPSEIVALKSLANFGLRFNDISGTIPTEMWMMPALTRVDLATNRLSGTFPTEVSQAVDMKAFIMYENELKGTLPTEIGAIKSIYYFMMDDNQIDGTIPTEIGEWTGLNRLWIANNLLSGTIPSQLGASQSSINGIILSGNNLGGTIPDQLFLSPSSIRDLYLDKNQLSGTLSTLIGNMTSLSAFNVQFNHLNGTIPSQLQYLEKPESIVLNGNDFTGTMPKSICSLRSTDFSELTADCYPDATSGLIELTCPDNCCTQCCNSEGTCFMSSAATRW